MAGTEGGARGRTRSPKTIQAPDTPDPIEIAMRQVRGSTSQGPAHDLLISSNRLAQSDVALRQMQIRNERMSFTLKLLTILVGVSVALAIVALVLSAQRARGLVIEAFSVPPEYARRGVTGEVVASQLLDRLATLDARTDSIRAPNTYSNDWSGDITVEIPQTGVSIGELNRALRASLGDETRITGELFRNGDQLVMTARAGAKPGTSASGADADFNALLDRTAEGLFKATQPYRFATQLRVQGRVKEARAIYRELAEGTNPIERPWGYIGLGVIAAIDSTDEEARRLTLPATTLDPTNALAFGNVASYERRLGLWQSSTQHAEMAVRLLSGGRNGGIRADSVNEWRLSNIAAHKWISGDRLGAAQTYGRIGKQVGAFDNRGLLHARALADVHQLGDAESVLRNMPAPTATIAQAKWLNLGNRTEVLMVIATERGAWSELLKLADTFRRHAAEVRRTNDARRFSHWEALGLAETGRPDAAKAAIALSRSDCHPCTIAKARIAELAGDRADADRIFSRAVKQAPSLPYAEQAWGEARMRRRDLPGALAAFHAASDKAPLWADPLKGLGDALALSRRDEEAVGFYRKAAERAPRWGALYLAWGTALWRTGERESAQEKLRAAAAMDLSPGDRGKLGRAWNVARSV